MGKKQGPRPWEPGTWRQKQGRPQLSGTCLRGSFIHYKYLLSVAGPQMPGVFPVPPSPLPQEECSFKETSILVLGFFFFFNFLFYFILFFDFLSF